MAGEAASSSRALRRKAVDMFLAATPPPGAPIDDYRSGFERLCCGFEPLPEAVITPFDADGVKGLKVAVPDASPDHLILHFHSGGYVMGSSAGYRNFASRLSRAAKATVIVPDYRLAPEHPYPAAFEDGLRTYRWAIRTWSPSKAVISGDSAGGGLMMAVLLALRDAGDPLPCRAVGISPLADLAGEGDSMVVNESTDPLINRALLVGMGKVYIGERDPHQTPNASPLWGRHHGLPPVYLTASNSEVMRDDAVRLAESIRKAGGQVTLALPVDLVHIWPLFPFLDEGRNTIAEIGTFIQAGWMAAGSTTTTSS
jgi:monoterpene epsilon-lactone hydrolase